MADRAKPRSPKPVAAFTLAVFTVLNGAAVALALAAASAEAEAVLVLPEDTAAGVRILMALVGFVAGFFMARTIFSMLLDRMSSVEVAASAAMFCFLFCGSTLFTLAFLGVVGWLWLSLLFLALLLPSLPTFWQLAGTGLTAMAVGAGVLSALLVAYWTGAA